MVLLDLASCCHSDLCRPALFFPGQPAGVDVPCSYQEEEEIGREGERERGREGERGKSGREGGKGRRGGWWGKEEKERDQKRKKGRERRWTEKIRREN